MPNHIQIYSISCFQQYFPEIYLDPNLTGFLAIAYPGHFMAVADTCEEALQLCKLRLRNSRNKHTDDWDKWSKNREKMILGLLAKKGINADFVWEEGDIGKIE